MSYLRSLRVWLIADDHLAAVAAIRGLLEERGAAVEILDLDVAIERLVLERGGQLLDNLKDLWRRARGSSPAAAGQDGAPPQASAASAPPADPAAAGDPKVASMEVIGPDKGAEAAKAPAEQSPVAEQSGALEAALQRGRPDMIVVTSPRTLKVLDLVSRAAGGEALLVALLPDYNLGKAWLKGAVHAFVIPHEGLRGPLQEAGVDPVRVFVGGPAIPRAYAEAHDPKAIRGDLGLDTAQGPVALILGAAISAANLDELILQLSLVDRPWQPIFHVGGNAEAAEQLRRSARAHGLPARMLGEVANLHDFVAAADLVLTHPADGLVTCALALDKPLLLVGDPGPVTTQCDFLVSQGAALHVVDVLRLSAEAEFALSPDRLGAMAEASARVGRRTGTQEVVDALGLIVERRQQIEGPPSDPGQQAEGPRFKGPFEMIGAPPSQPRPARPVVSAPTSGGAPSTPLQAAPATSSASPLSAAQAKDQLAALIMEERELERTLEEARREQTRWHQRLELARQWNEQDLAREAERVLQRAIGEAERASAQLEQVRVQKEKLKARVRGGQSPPPGPGAQPPARAGEGIVGRFQDMEIEDDLGRLKARLRDELGKG